MQFSGVRISPPEFIANLTAIAVNRDFFRRLFNQSVPFSAVAGAPITPLGIMMVGRRSGHEQLRQSISAV